MHNVHHQARPSREMLRSLPNARFRVILFPGKARFLPLVEDVVDEVGAEFGVHGPCAVLVGAGGGGDELFGAGWSAGGTSMNCLGWGEKEGTYV